MITGGVASVAVALLMLGAPQARQLPAGVPAANHAMYAAIRDAKDWRNPKITIRVEGIEVESAAPPAYHQTVPAAQVADVLTSLPTSAWPYGRVVLVAEIHVRRVGGVDDAPIREHRRALITVLKSLEIEADLWP